MVGDTAGFFFCIGYILFLRKFYRQGIFFVLNEFWPKQGRLTWSALVFCGVLFTAAGLAALYWSFVSWLVLDQPQNSQLLFIGMAVSAYYPLTLLKFLVGRIRARYVFNIREAS